MAQEARARAAERARRGDEGAAGCAGDGRGGMFSPSSALKLLRFTASVSRSRAARLLSALASGKSVARSGVYAKRAPLKRPLKAEPAEARREARGEAQGWRGGRRGV